MYAKSIIIKENINIFKIAEKKQILYKKTRFFKALNAWGQKIKKEIYNKFNVNKHITKA